MSSIEMFFTVFGIIFVAELPDKTALAALVLATRHNPMPVFLGSALALSIQSVVAILLGSLIAKLPNEYVHLGAGALFIICAGVMWFRKEDDEEDVKDDPNAGFWKSLWTVFVVVFIAEWGDLTQIGTATLQAKYNSWLIVGGASILALWCVAGLAVFVGNKAGKLLKPEVTQKVAAILFAIVGILMIVSALR